MSVSCHAWTFIHWEKLKLPCSIRDFNYLKWKMQCIMEDFCEYLIHIQWIAS